MTEPLSDDALDMLAGAARDEEAPLEKERIDSIVDSALMDAYVGRDAAPRESSWRAISAGVAERVAAEAPEAFEEDDDLSLPSRFPLGRLGTYGAAAAALLLIVLAGAWWSSSDEGAGRATRLQLPTGDQIVATAGSRFEVERATTAARRIRLDDGAVLFDVAPLRGQARFRVDARGTRVHVRGTVFSVETDGASTTVRVYEGRVEVEHGGVRRALPRGSVWSSSPEAAAPDAELHRLGHAAAARRDADRGAPPAERLNLPVEGSEAIDERPTKQVSAATPTPTAPTDETAGSREADRGDDLATPRSRRESSREATGVRRQPGRELTPGLVDVRGWIAEADYERALEATRQALRAGPSGPWSFAQGDALRGLRRFRAAAASYDRAARQLRGVRRQQAGFMAANLRLHHLRDALGALASLDGSEADAEGSPLLERALSLRVRVLFRLGREEAARREAERYLARFPEHATADWMRRLTARP